MQAVNILVRINRTDDRHFVKMFRQWQLDKNTVDRIISISPLHQCDQFVLRRVGG